MNHEMFPTEEDIKNKILLPYLFDLGFNISEIKFEKTFSIRLGRNKYKKENTKRGRLDILCHKNGKNLFVIEVKSLSAKIDQDDIDQGISYARLLDNIAPFVLITNGEDTRIIDSVTKADLTELKISEKSDFWKNNCTLSADKDIEIRFEAFSNFISFSDENIKIFSTQQRFDRMNTLVGNNIDLDAKYNNYLHVDRQELDQNFEKFLVSKESVFALIGESGVGKTHALCHLCLNESPNTINLFYNGTLLSDNIIDSLAIDFNLFFSVSQQRLKILSSINSVAKSIHKTVVVFIDAVDEVTIPNFRVELSNFSLTLKSLNYIKLCVSCKKNVWEDFLVISGIKTYLYDLVFKPNLQIERNKIPGFYLERFNSNELKSAIVKFFSAYNIKGDINRYPHLYEDFRHGLFLHLFCQVFQGQQIPPQIPFNALLKKYIEYKLLKIGNSSQEIILPILSKLGILLIENQNNTLSRISLQQLKEFVGLKITDYLPDELFSHNILIKNEKDSEVYVSFYYSRLRDYIIINYSYRLYQLSSDGFESILPLFYNGNIGMSAIYVYSQEAKPNHQKILDQYIKHKLTNYLGKYEEFLNRNLYETKESFDPFTKGSIGMIISKSLLSINETYALFPMDEYKDNASKIIEIDNFSFRNDKVFEECKAKTIHGSFNDLTKNNVDKNVTRDIYNQLKKIIENQELNETVSKVLLIEKVVHLIYEYREKLGLNIGIQSYHYPRLADLYPIDLKEIKLKVYEFFAKEFYIGENIQQQIRDGRIKGNNNVYSYSQKQLDWDIINKNVGLAMVQNIPIETVDSSPLVLLGSCIDKLIDNGIERIENHYLPLPDIPVSQIKNELIKRNRRQNWIPSIVEAQFSETTAKLYVQNFIKILEECYSEIVEACFPTIKNQLNYYSTIPHHYVIFFDYFAKSDLNNFGFGYGNSDDKTLKVEFTNREFSHDYFEIFDIKAFYRPNIAGILYDNRNNHRLAKGVNKSKVEEYMIIRSWVYKFLKDDIEKYIKDYANDIN